MRNNDYLRIRRIFRIAKDFLIIILFILMIVAKLNKL